MSGNPKILRKPTHIRDFSLGQRQSLCIVLGSDVSVPSRWLLRATVAKRARSEAVAVPKNNGVQYPLLVATRNFPTRLVYRSRAFDGGLLFLQAQWEWKKENFNPTVKEWLDDVIVPALVNRFLTKCRVMGTDSLVTCEKLVAKLPQLGES